MRIFIFAGGRWLNCVWRGSSCFLYPKNMFCNALWKITVDVFLHWNTSFLIFFSLFLGIVPGISATICVEIQWPLWDDAERRQVVRTCLSYQKLRQPCLFQDRKFLNSPSTCSVISTKINWQVTPGGAKMDDDPAEVRVEVNFLLTIFEKRPLLNSQHLVSNAAGWTKAQGKKGKKQKRRSSVVLSRSARAALGLVLVFLAVRRKKTKRKKRQKGWHQRIGGGCSNHLPCVDDLWISMVLP